MLIQKIICNSCFLKFLAISIIYFAFPSTIFGEDTTIYDPAKGRWVSLGTQCPQGAAGPATEPISGVFNTRIHMQYKITQAYTNRYTASGCCWATADHCKDGSVVPATGYTSSCLKEYSTTQCVDFPGFATGNGPPWEGEFPILFRCFEFINSSGNQGWTYEVRAFCTKYLTAYEWRLKNESDSASNFGGPPCN